MVPDVPYPVLVQSATFRAMKRVPALTFFHAASKTSMYRCSQPLSGLFNRMEYADIQVCKMIAKMSPSQCIMVFDARPYASA